jgi:mannobiose 2-epimerase
MSRSRKAIKAEYLPKLRQNLIENILPFWYPSCIDEEYGGYILSYDKEGEFAGDDDKMIVTQARMIWLFARLEREGYGDGEYLDASQQGLSFLIEHMWDDDHGGFYWKVNRNGSVTKPNKHMYGQAFGLYALAEYYRATDDDRAESLALDLYETMEREAKDHEHGGYMEYFEPDWTPIETGRTYLENIEPDWSTKESGNEALDPTFKLTNTHLHLLEAFTTFHRAIGTKTSATRLQELLHILTNTVVRKQLTATTDKYNQKWVPQLDGDELGIVSYGHDLENIWLTMEAADTLDVSVTLFQDLYERLFEYSLEYGYDDEHGGFYFFGPFETNATNKIKAWWVQAECMTSALKMYDRIGDDQYLELFADIYDFIDEFHVDWEGGEWHSGVDEDLNPVGRKGAEYKGAYHNGRAMLECINLLEQY